MHAFYHLHLTVILQKPAENQSTCAPLTVHAPARTTDESPARPRPSDLTRQRIIEYASRIHAQHRRLAIVHSPAIRRCSNKNTQLPILPLLCYTPRAIHLFLPPSYVLRHPTATHLSIHIHSPALHHVFSLAFPSFIPFVLFASQPASYILTHSTFFSACSLVSQCFVFIAIQSRLSVILSSIHSSLFTRRIAFRSHCLSIPASPSVRSPKTSQKVLINQWQTS
ncbi:hypothetical protein CNBD2770 [Cryptococcus deneoformans B-3501A]|uniref:hypothetical protein n=1 Tax=Cryptococcus deneoformans (strain B-3501A) TaxID=283643 RepID=UPI000042C6E7|nr:hypothetical protein CNBD2770 [Cryptococcus neoformans var. neoformans B-3501A]EAL21222.1 hypothetical protein CNBD2770 [Cryptococcus neoformans var. neoformans B-3501A]